MVINLQILDHLTFCKNQGSERITLGMKFLKLKVCTDIKGLKKAGIKGLRVYATVQNPFKALAPYTFETGLDPETNSTGNSNVATGYGGGMGRQAMVGYNTPYTRNFLFGVNITF